MSGAQELAVREKQELDTKEEKTTPGRYYVPAADIFETDEALTVILEMPGVQKNNVNIGLENDILRVDGQIDFSNYKEMEPVYTEYNVGHYTRGFTFQTKSTKAKSARSLIAAC
jgi:HSP20 family protein